MGTDAPSVNDGISVGGQAISRNDAPGWPLTAKRALPGDGPSATAAHSHAEVAMYPPHGGFREAAEVLGDKGDIQGIDLGGANPARLGQLPPLHEGWVESDGLGLLRAGRDGEAGEIASLVRGAQEYHGPAFMAGKIRVGKRVQDDIARLKRHSTPRLRRCSSR